MSTTSKNTPPNTKHPLLQWFGGLFLIGFLVALYYHFFPEKILKSELADRYNVSTKVLMNWTKKLTPQNVQDKYLGNKSKFVLIKDFHPTLGSPEDRPVDRRERAIISKQDITRAFFIEQTTLSRRINEIEDHQKTIGMSKSSFSNLRQLPPKQVKLILDYIISQGYELK